MFSRQRRTKFRSSAARVCTPSFVPRWNTFYSRHCVLSTSRYAYRSSLLPMRPMQRRYSSQSSLKSAVHVSTSPNILLTTISSYRGKWNRTQHLVAFCTLINHAWLRASAISFYFKMDVCRQGAGKWAQKVPYRYIGEVSSSAGVVNIVSNKNANSEDIKTLGVIPECFENKMRG